MVLFIFNITKTTINESPRKIILSEYLHKPDDHIRRIYHHDRLKYLEISDHCTYQVHRLLLFQNIFEYSYRYQNILDLERYDDLHEPLPYQTLGPWYKALQEALGCIRNDSIDSAVEMRRSHKFFNERYYPSIGIPNSQRFHKIKNKKTAVKISTV